MGATGRTERNAQLPQDFARTIDRRTKTMFTLGSALPYVEHRVISYVANTANGPNAVEPADSAVVLTDDVSHVALFPEWTIAAQLVKIRVWAKDESLTATAPLWRCVGVVTFDGSGDDVETEVPVGYRGRAFFEAVSGVDAGHPINLHVSVC